MYFLYLFIMLCSVTQALFCSEGCALDQLSRRLAIVHLNTGKILKYTSSDEEELEEEEQIQIDKLNRYENHRRLRCLETKRRPVAEETQTLPNKKAIPEDQSAAGEEQSKPRRKEMEETERPANKEVNKSSAKRKHSER